MGELFITSEDINADIAYYRRHRTRPSFIKAVRMVNSWQDCKSILDVGCRSAGFVYQATSQYTRRVATDIYKPLYMGGTDKLVKFIHADFLNLEFTEPFDVVVCMETMEHIDEPNRLEFADKLMSLTKKHLLVSIPYMWKNSKEPIDHNGFNEKHIIDWFGLNGQMTIMGDHLLAEYSI